MTIHVLVEGPSERAFLEPWGRRLLGGAEFRVHPHQGKGTLPKGRALDERPDPKRRGLLDQLPAKLRGFASSLDLASDAILVLVDADDDDPGELRREIKALVTRSPSLRGVVALAVEEIEAFYLGDLKALKKAFPDADMELARSYEPDSVVGTWELFGRVIGDGGGNKVVWGEAMGRVLTTQPERNRSPSFKQLVAGLRELVPQKRGDPERRRHRHVAKDRKDPSRRR